MPHPRKRTSLSSRPRIGSIKEKEVVGMTEVERVEKPIVYKDEVFHDVHSEKTF